MANKKTFNDQIAAYKAALAAHNEKVESFKAKERELSDKLADLQSQLEQIEIEASDESLAKEAALRDEISKTESLLEVIKDRLAEIRHRTGLTELGNEAFELAKQEAAQEYYDKLPGLLEEIKDAKQAYLQKLIEYHDLKAGVSQNIRAAAIELNRSPNTSDFPRLKEIAWNYTDHREADGVKYTVTSYDINLAIEHGQLQYTAP